jgi:hypothetical protein
MDSQANALAEMSADLEDVERRLQRARRMVAGALLLDVLLAAGLVFLHGVGGGT